MRRASVIGAGLAGASVAHALALRGWQVTVLDAAARPAQGASGLPAGLMSARTGKKPNAEPSPLALQSATATRRVLAQLREGIDWAPSGAIVMPDGRVDAEVCWVKPAALVAHWLAHPNIQVTCGQTVDGPQALQALTQQTDAVVVAAGAGSIGLLPGHNLHAVRGQVSMGLANAAHEAPEQPVGWPSRPVRGDGTFIPSVLIEGQPMWLSAASYDHERTDLVPSEAEHQQNRQRIHRLIGHSHPAAVAAIDRQFGEQFAAGHVSAWVGLRCTTPTRQPVAQRVGKKFYALTGLGSRGITLAALLGQQLAAQIDADLGLR